MSTGLVCGSTTSTLANMPGSKEGLPSAVSGFSSSACTRTVRVLELISVSMAVISPSKVRPGTASVTTRTGCPSAMRPSTCCGNETLTRMGSVFCSETMGTPCARSCPMSTWRRPSRPANGATMRFLSRLVRMFSTCASAFSNCALAASRSDCETALLRRSRSLRSSVLRASASADSAARSCATSVEVSCSSSTSPASTSSPPSKYNCVTRPGRSAVMVTPWAASMVPMPSSVTSHSAFSATAEVMAVGGICCSSPAAIRSWICTVFRPASTPITSSTPSTARAIRFIIVRGILEGGDSRGRPRAGDELGTRAAVSPHRGRQRGDVPARHDRSDRSHTRPHPKKRRDWWRSRHGCRAGRRAYGFVSRAAQRARAARSPSEADSMASGSSFRSSDSTIATARVTMRSRRVGAASAGVAEGLASSGDSPHASSQSQSLGSSKSQCVASGTDSSAPRDPSKSVRPLPAALHAAGGPARPSKRRVQPCDRVRAEPRLVHQIERDDAPRDGVVRARQQRGERTGRESRVHVAARHAAQLAPARACRPRS